MGFHVAAFSFLNLAIMPLWFGLLFLPRQRWVTPAIDVFVLVAATLFVVNLIPGLSQAFPVIVNPTIESVGQLLSTRAGTLGSWSHFVIGDLWIGRWITEDGYRQKLSRWFIFPILILTLLFGPLGLLTYFLLKLATRRKLGVA